MAVLVGKEAPQFVAKAVADGKIIDNYYEIRPLIKINEKKCNKHNRFGYSSYIFKYL